VIDEVLLAARVNDAESGVGVITKHAASASVGEAAEPIQNLCVTTFAPQD
jgi:hypothetical protein